MAGAERNQSEHEVILEPRGLPFRSLQELVDDCLPALTARLWATCCWPTTMAAGYKIGDHNWLVAEVRPDPQTCLYVQFWSEPQDPVLAEVCSGEWNPGALKYLQRRQREDLEELGYTIESEPINFRKEVEIRTSTEAEALAREALGIFFAVFGFRGQWALEIECYQGERAEHQPVHSAVTPSDFARLGAHLGLEVSSLTSNPRTLCLRKGRRQFLAHIGDSGAEGQLHSVVTLEASLAAPDTIDSATVDRMRDALRFTRLSRAGQRALALTMPLRLDGGVTVNWMTSSLQQWFAEWRVCEHILRGLRAPGTTRSSRHPSNGSTVH